MYLEFEVPDEMQREAIAKTFAAYLLGSQTFDGVRTRDEGVTEYCYGPYRKDEASDAHWQLDHSNNFFLHFDDDTSARIGCRYDWQQPVVQAMLALFQLRYPAKA